jgi:hypothetical protein
MMIVRTLLYTVSVSELINIKLSEVDFTDVKSGLSRERERRTE